MNDSRSPDIAADGDLHSSDSSDSRHAAVAILVVRKGKQETGHE